MYKRMIELYIYLSENKNYNLDELAKLLDVSTRTLRHDIDNLNAYLDQQGISFIEISKSGDIVAPLDIHQFSLERCSFYDYKFSREERLVVEIIGLMKSDMPQTIETIETELQLSRNTIVADLKSLREKLRNNGLLVQTGKYGLNILGDESRKRQVLMDCYLWLRTNPFLISKIYPTTAQTDELAKIIRSIEKRNDVVFKDDSFYFLVAYLTLVNERLQQGKRINQTEQFQYSAQSLVLSRQLLEELSKVKTSIDLKEVEFLATVLDTISYEKKLSPSGDSFKIQFLTRQFIKRISDEIHLDLTNDYQLLENLSKHLEMIFAQASPNYPQNSILSTIASEHEALIQTIKDNVTVYETLDYRALNQEDIYYIAVHIFGAIERYHLATRLKVIIACHAGLGTAQLLKAKLLENYNFDIIDTVTIHEAENENYSVDLIISTVPLKHSLIPTITVSTALTEQDIINVNRVIKQLYQSQTNIYSVIPSQSDSLFKDRLKKILREENIDTAKIERILTKVDLQLQSESTVTKGVSDFISLSGLLSQDFIRLNIRATDWKEAICQVGLVLKEHGYIEQSYIDAMIENVLNYGPYIVVAKGVAVAHAGIDDGVNQLGMALCRLKEPVAFGNPDLDPVSYVICLCVTDYDSHIPSFLRLVNLMQDNQFREQLDQAKDSATIAHLIQKYE